MARFIRLEKPDFIGKAASLSKKQRGERMRLVYLEVDATDSDCMGNEPVYSNGSVVGVTTSGAYGHAAEKSLAFAYVNPRLTAEGTPFEILMMGERRSARITSECAWDPDNRRPRA